MSYAKTIISNDTIFITTAKSKTYAQYPSDVVIANISSALWESVWALPMIVEITDEQLFA